MLSLFVPDANRRRAFAPSGTNWSTEGCAQHPLFNLIVFERARHLCGSYRTHAGLRRGIS